MSTPTAPPRSSANRDGQHHKQAAKSKKKQQQAEKRCNSPTAGDWNELFEALEANGGLSAFGNSLNQFLQSPIAEQRGFNHRKIRQAHKRYTKFQTKRETAAKTKRKSKGSSKHTTSTAQNAKDKDSDNDSDSDTMGHNKGTKRKREDDHPDGSVCNKDGNGNGNGNKHVNGTPKLPAPDCAVTAPAGATAVAGLSTNAGTPRTATSTSSAATCPTGTPAILYPGRSKTKAVESARDKYESTPVVLQTRSLLVLAYGLADDCDFEKEPLRNLSGRQRAIPKRVDLMKEAQRRFYRKELSIKDAFLPSMEWNTKQIKKWLQDYPIGKEDDLQFVLDKMAELRQSLPETPNEQRPMTNRVVSQAQPQQNDTAAPTEGTATTAKVASIVSSRPTTALSPPISTNVSPPLVNSTSHSTTSEINVNANTTTTNIQNKDRSHENNDNDSESNNSNDGDDNGTRRASDGPVLPIPTTSH